MSDPSRTALDHAVDLQSSTVGAMLLTLTSQSTNHGRAAMPKYNRGKPQTRRLPCSPVPAHTTDCATTRHGLRPPGSARCDGRCADHDRGALRSRRLLPSPPRVADRPAVCAAHCGLPAGKETKVWDGLVLAGRVNIYRRQSSFLLSPGKPSEMAFSQSHSREATSTMEGRSTVGLFVQPRHAAGTPCDSHQHHHRPRAQQANHDLQLVQQQRPQNGRPCHNANTYRDLIGELANLPNLPLGWHTTLQATSAISGYGPATGDDVAAVKRALATLTVTTSEAQRLQPIWDLLAKGGRVGRHAWASSTCQMALHRAAEGATNIKSKKEALAVVGAITDRNLEDLMEAHSRRA
ncbi:hypothetical protein HU200_012631 [Digitaria exilis]|uniref:rRNA N-glycosylase n=1 Tax=Digitaria exilis TaxID=1010633 RepID=A0A835KPL1_9POAL|nr:hypothetical protein HU200_012631 [Digitaria exilis]